MVICWWSYTDPFGCERKLTEPDCSTLLTLLREAGESAEYEVERINVSEEIYGFLVHLVRGHKPEVLRSLLAEAFERGEDHDIVLDRERSIALLNLSKRPRR